MPEAQRRLFKDQAKTLMDSVEEMEGGMAKLVKAKEELQADYDRKLAEKQEAINMLRQERREHQEAANQLMAMADEEKPYDIPRQTAGRSGDFTKPARSKVERTCPKCEATVYVGKARKSCPVAGCDGKLLGVSSGVSAGKGRVFRECPDCLNVSAVHASLQSCPQCQGKFNMDKTTEAPEGWDPDAEETDEDEDEDEPDPEPEDGPDDEDEGKKPWERPGAGKFEMKCVRCQRTVYVNPGVDICPDDACHGNLYGSDPKTPPYKGGQNPPAKKKAKSTARKSSVDTDWATESSPKKPEPVAWDPEPWKKRALGTIAKGCRRCEEKIFVLPHVTICPREGCSGVLVSAK